MNKKKILFLPLILTLTGCEELSSTTPITTPSTSSPSTPILSTEDKNDAETINILVGGQVVDSIDVNEGETVDIEVEVLPEGVDQDFTYTLSDETIATFDGTTVTGLHYGTSILTITSTATSYVSKSIFINVTEVISQTDVGSGLTVSDPIYIGNEGDSEPIEVYFLEMQHIYSDSIFIKKGAVEILIDAGYAYDGLYISDFLAEHMEDDRLDMLVVSHSDGDHIEGLPNALADIENISLMVDYGGVNSGIVGNIREEYIAKGTQYHSAYDSINYLNGASDRYYLTDDFYVDILDTGNYIAPTDNNASNPESVACIFTYKDFKFFTGGDLTSAAERDLLANEDLPEVTLFKAHHHGSNGSNSQDFLDTINPKAVGISAARADRFGTTPGPSTPSNTYNLDASSGHPYDEAIQRIYSAPRIKSNKNVYWNAVNGTMHFTSYGTDDFTFQGSPTMKGYYDLTLTGGTPIWSDELNDFENKVTGEENLKFHETKAFKFRGYDQLIDL